MKTGRKPTQKEYQDLLEKKDFNFSIDDVTIYSDGTYHIETPKEILDLVDQLLGI